MFARCQFPNAPNEDTCWHVYQRLNLTHTPLGACWIASRAGVVLYVPIIISVRLLSWCDEAKLCHRRASAHDTSVGSLRKIQTTWSVFIISIYHCLRGSVSLTTTASSGLSTIQGTAGCTNLTFVIGASFRRPTWVEIRDLRILLEYNVLQLHEVWPYADVLRQKNTSFCISSACVWK